MGEPFSRITLGQSLPTVLDCLPLQFLPGALSQSRETCEEALGNFPVRPRHQWLLAGGSSADEASRAEAFSARLSSSCHRPGNGNCRIASFDVWSDVKGSKGGTIQGKETLSGMVKWPPEQDGRLRGLDIYSASALCEEEY